MRVLCAAVKIVRKDTHYGHVLLFRTATAAMPSHASTTYRLMRAALTGQEPRGLRGNRHVSLNRGSMGYSNPCSTTCLLNPHQPSTADNRCSMLFSLDSKLPSMPVILNPAW